ncbi:MAG TPA: molybdopterin-dependent oxidoreductase, partial [Terriglobales bacterium]|nr:molybdopterin-dependent oxidoreductase [Terriglobales bacterium]
DQEKPDPEIPPSNSASAPEDDETKDISRTSLQKVAAGAGRKKISQPEAKDDAGGRFMSEKEFRSMNRREVLKLTPLVLAGAFAIDKFRTPLLNRGVAFSDWAAGAIFRKSALATTFSDSQVVPFEKFPYNGYDVIDPEVDLENWTLTVEGNVQKPGEYTLAQIQGLPKLTQNTRHVCVEGWDVIGNFGGAPVSGFLRLIGADTNSRFVEVECADDYYESLDMASMLQPQSLMCYEMYGKPLDRGHGAPVRLQMPTKLGYKQAKYLTTFRVTNVLKPEKRGYWEDQGYSWHGGL